MVAFLGYEWTDPFPPLVSGRQVELELWVGDLARGAQQQAAQRKKRQGKEGGDKNGLMHERDYSGIIGVEAN
jgi:hypothetical protein